MRRYLIVGAAMAVLAGEPALAAAFPVLEVPRVNLGLLPGLLYQLGQHAWASASLPVR